MTIRTTAGVAILLMGLGACQTMPQGRAGIVKAPVACASQTVQIYFEPDSAQVSRESAAVIHAAAHGAQGCKVVAVEVMGLADSAGAANASLEISKRRAQSVTAALTADGLPAAEFKVSAAGQAGATNKKGQDRPLRRRVDVILRLAPL